jgi:hypothetical protein
MKSKLPSSATFQKEFPLMDRIAAKSIPILTLIQNEYPDFDESKFYPSQN